MHEEKRKIIHVDMDAFYASVEQHDFPELKGKALAVGGSRERGVVAAASYEARVFGVKSAMPSQIAARKCPGLIFVKPRFERYKEISEKIRTVFFKYTDLVEPLSLDEAFLDVTENKKNMLSATQIAEAIRSEIFESTGLTASAGIAKNKFLAKVASDRRKPNGQFVIHPSKSQLFVDQLPIEDFFGVGVKTAERMHLLGIKTGADLKERSIEFLKNTFGKAGLHYYSIARSIDNREVKPNRERKSVGAENTLNVNLTGKTSMLLELESICQTVEKRMLKSKVKGTTITLKVKFDDFQTITRSVTLEKHTRSAKEIFNTIAYLLESNFEHNWTVRLLGVSLKNLRKDASSSASKQLTLHF